MQGITAGELRLTGGFGIRQILGFSMREYPGEHARAEADRGCRGTGRSHTGTAGSDKKQPGGTARGRGKAGGIQRNGAGSGITGGKRVPSAAPGTVERECPDGPEAGKKIFSGSFHDLWSAHYRDNVGGGNDRQCTPVSWMRRNRGFR